MKHDYSFAPTQPWIFISPPSITQETLHTFYANQELLEQSSAYTKSSPYFQANTKVPVTFLSFLLSLLHFQQEEIYYKTIKILSIKDILENCLLSF